MGRGEKSLQCDPGSELRLGGRENARAKIINGMEKICKYIHMGVRNSAAEKLWELFTDVFQLFIKYTKKSPTYILHKDKT